MGSTRVTGGGAPALSLWYNHGIITPYHTPKHVIHQPKLKYPCSRQDFRGPLRFWLSTMRLIPQHCSNVLSFRSIRLLFFLSYLSMCFLSCLSYLYHRSCPPIYWNSGVHCTKSCGSVVLLIGHRYLCLEVSSASDRMLPFETTNATMSQKHHSKCLDLCHKVVIIGVMFTRCHSFWSTKIYYRETLTKIYYSTKKYWKDPKIFGQPERGKAGNVEVFPCLGPVQWPVPWLSRMMYLPKLDAWVEVTARSKWSSSHFDSSWFIFQSTSTNQLITLCFIESI